MGKKPKGKLCSSDKSLFEQRMLEVISVPPQHKFPQFSAFHCGKDFEIEPKNVRAPIIGNHTKAAKWKNDLFLLCPYLIFPHYFGFKECSYFLWKSDFLKWTFEYFGKSKSVSLMPFTAKADLPMLYRHYKISKAKLPTQPLRTNTIFKNWSIEKQGRKYYWLSLK